MERGNPWVFIIEENKIRENRLNVVFPNRLPLLLIKREGLYYGLSNKCAHMACGMEGGVLKEYVLQCPCHDWKYDIRTGVFLDATEIKVSVYELKVSEGNIYLKMEE